MSFRWEQKTLLQLLINSDEYCLFSWSCVTIQKLWPDVLLHNKSSLIQSQLTRSRNRRQTGAIDTSLLCTGDLQPWSWRTNWNFNRDTCYTNVWLPFKCVSLSYTVHDNRGNVYLNTTTSYSDFTIDILYSHLSWITWLLFIVSGYFMCVHTIMSKCSVVGIVHISSLWSHGARWFPLCLMFILFIHILSSPSVIAQRCICRLICQQSLLNSMNGEFVCFCWIIHWPAKDKVTHCLNTPEVMLALADVTHRAWCCWSRPTCTYWLTAAT